MTGQHERPWKPEVKSGAPEWKAFPAPHAGTCHDVPYIVFGNEAYSWRQYHGLQISLAMVVTETR